MATISQDEKRSLLGSVHLFSGLAARELAALVGVARTIRLAARDQLFHKGDKGTQIYVVIEGKLKALTTSDSGDDVVFNILAPGEVFGEVALLGKAERTATVMAIDPCHLLVIDRRDFLGVLRTHPDVAVELLRVLAERLTRASELVEDTLFLNLPLRLAKKLASLSHAYGEKTATGVRINLKLSQEEWGDMVGVTRESVNKQFRAWSEEGLMRVEQGYVVLLRPEQFEQLAGLVIF